MGFMATIKAQQAMRAHGKGDLEQAKKLYEEAIDKGLMSARPMLGYAILLIREGQLRQGDAPAHQGAEVP